MRRDAMSFFALDYIVLDRRCTGLGHTENNTYSRFNKINERLFCLLIDKLSLHCYHSKKFKK